MSLQSQPERIFAMKPIPPNRPRRKRLPKFEAENLILFGDHVFIRRWTVDAQCNVSILEVLRHA